jgi:hypothetical protein
MADPDSTGLDGDEASNQFLTLFFYQGTNILGNPSPGHIGESEKNHTKGFLAMGIDQLAKILIFGQ